VGIELELKHVSPWCLERLLEAPAAVETFFVAEPRNLPGTADLARLEASCGNHLADQIRELAAHDWRSAGLEHLKELYPRDYARVQPQLDAILAEWNEPSLDLHKDWRQLDAALEECCRLGLGASSNVLTGGTPIGHDLGYGPARYFLPAEVAAHAAGMPDVINLVRALGDERIQDLYRRVKEYYAQAANRGRAMLLCFG
jgi:hypothetical protein